MRGARPLENAEVRAVIGQFRGRAAGRNACLFTLGVNTGFRISELLSLTLGDVIEERGGIKQRVTVWRRNMKGKHSSRTVVLNANARAALTSHVEAMRADGYLTAECFLFHSTRGNKPIDRVQAYKVLRSAFRGCQLTGRLGTHAMRKTFANGVYRSFLARVSRGESIDAFRSTSKALGHKNITSTDQYLSFLESDIDDAIISLAAQMEKS